MLQMTTKLQKLNYIQVLLTKQAELMEHFSKLV